MTTRTAEPRPLAPPDWWWHEAHQLHDHNHHLAHRPLDLCVPLWDATPESRAEAAAPAGLDDRLRAAADDAGWLRLEDALDLLHGTEDER